MFRNRQSSQKPPDELFERFRQSFPNVVTTAPPSGQQEAALPPLGMQTQQPRFADHADLDPTPRAPGEPFQFTPSLTPSAFMDPNSAAFAAFANQTIDIFTPTPATTSSYRVSNSITANTMAPSHDLQTPGIGIITGPPLSLTNGVLQSSDAQGFAPPQAIQPHFNYTSFTEPLHHSQYLGPQHFDPRPPSGPGSPMDLSGVEPTPDPMTIAESLNGISAPMNPPMPLDQKQFDAISQRQCLPPPTSDRFRWHVVLNAPTAMIKHPEEIPVTYLNKGQAYGISIQDTQPPPPGSPPIKYRLYIRVSFHDETQRNRPAQCWQLWKEGRGTNEAHQRGGKLQAVEFVESQANGDDDKKKKAKVTLESSSFDGFSCIWSPTPGGAHEASVSVRFNFLSTDFSHSKGVKGIPVRLCAKSEVISNDSPLSSPLTGAEVCYCKVKLFRDHGAERKLSNDIQHVKKTIEKLRQQANQGEGTGMKIFGKKSKKMDDDYGKLGKAVKHKRTWSMSSATSVNGMRTHEDETNSKLQVMQDMFSSTRPVSVLYLRGEEQDDPDAYAVRLPGEDGDDSWAALRRASIATTNTTASSFVSPTPSSASISSQRGGSFSPEKGDWQSYKAAPSSQIDNPVRVKSIGGDGVLSGWIEAIGIDHSYRPPAEEPPKAVMSIYILPVVPNAPEKQQYHRAVYLQQRTATCLANSIAAKCGIDPATVFRTVHINPRNLSIIIDDEFVAQMSEAQDMKVQLKEITADSAMSSSEDWSGSNSIAINGSHHNGGDSNGTKKWELQLLF